MKSPIQQCMQSWMVREYAHHIKTQTFKRYVAKQAREAHAGVKVFQFRMDHAPDRSKAEGYMLKTLFYVRQFNMWLEILQGIQYENMPTVG